MLYKKNKCYVYVKFYINSIFIIKSKNISVKLKILFLISVKNELKKCDKSMLFL